MKRIKKVLLVGLILTCFCYLINGTAITAFAAGTSKTIEDLYMSLMRRVTMSTLLLKSMPPHRGE